MTVKLRNWLLLQNIVKYLITHSNRDIPFKTKKNGCLVLDSWGESLLWRDVFQKLHAFSSFIHSFTARWKHNPSHLSFWCLTKQINKWHKPKKHGYEGVKKSSSFLHITLLLFLCSFKVHEQVLSCEPVTIRLTTAVFIPSLSSLSISFVLFFCFKFLHLGSETCICLHLLPQLVLQVCLWYLVKNHFMSFL